VDVIVTHKNTDFDAAASTFAARLVYPGAVPVLPTGLNPNVKQFLSIHKDVFPWKKPREIPWEEVRRLVVVDTNDWKRLEGVKIGEGPGPEIHLWDHHLSPATIEAAWEHSVAVGATTTLFARRLEEENIPISPIQATLFLAGIYEDTGNLTFPSTTPVDAQAVAYLLRRKADVEIVNTFLRPAYGPRQKDVLFGMLQAAERTKLNGYTVSVNHCEIQGHLPGLALVVEMYRDIVNVDAAFGIFTEAGKDRAMVIGRSAVDELDVGAVMRAMGGGGHPGAGSVLVKKGAVPERIRAHLLELIETSQRAAVSIGDLMSFPVHTVSEDTPMTEAARVLRDKGCTGLPVVRGEELVGVISRRDFKKFRDNGKKDPPVKAFMSRDVQTISPDRSVVHAARVMVKNDIGRLPVLENGRLIGILTRTDTMRYYYDLLPD
jgi:nanoRNase/pAp phosphatase (c-di-AMP/oligoRNAs hydrolase)